MNSGRIKPVSIDLILLFFTAFLFFINFYTTFNVIPLYILHIGGDEFSIGMQSTVFFISGVVLRFYFGPLTDKKGRKLPLLIGAFVFTTSPLILMLISNNWLLILFRVYQGVGLATFLSSASSLVADIAPKEKVGLYIGTYRIVLTMALLIGPAGSQHIINIYNFNTWFIVSFLIGLLGLIVILPIKSPPIKAEANDKFSTVNNLVMALKNKELWPAYFGVFLISTGYGAIMNFASVYISQVSNFTNTSLYFTVFALAGILGNLLAGFLSDRLARDIVVWPLVAFLALGCLSLYFLPRLPGIFFISSCLAGIGFSGGISALIAWLVDKAEQKLRGTVLSFQESAIDLAMASGAFLIGASSKIIPLALSFAMIGTVVFCLAAIFLLRALYLVRPPKF